MGYIISYGYARTSEPVLGFTPTDRSKFDLVPSLAPEAVPAGGGGGIGREEIARIHRTLGGILLRQLHKNHFSQHRPMNTLKVEP